MASKNEAKIIFTAETKEFNEAIKKSNQDISTLRSELRLNETQMKNTGTSVQGLARKKQLLTKELEAQKNKTQALEAKLKEAKKVYGDDSTEVARLTKQLSASKTAESNLEKELSNTNKELKEQQKRMGLTAEQSEKLKDGFDKVGNASGAVVAGVGAVAGGSVALFNEVDEGAKNAIKATGATGEQAKELRQNYKNVASSIRGDFSDIGSVLGEVQTRFDLTGKESEKITKKFVKFAEINNTDGVTSVQLVTRALRDAGIPLKDYEELLDKLTVGAQASGISIDTLTESIAKYGAPMRQLGFDTDESISILAGWEKAGVNTQIAFSGMKKAISNWSASGKDAKVEFGKTLDEIKKAPSLAKATTIAIENFGQKAGPDLADAIQNGRFEYSDFLKLLKKSKGSVENTYKSVENGTDEAKIAMQNLKLAGAEVGESLLKGAGPAIKDLTSKSKELAKYAETHGDEIVGTLKTIGVVAGTVFAVNKTANFVRSLGTFVNAGKAGVDMLKEMAAARVADTAAAEAGTVAQTGFMSVIKAHPIALATTAVVGLTAGIVALVAKSQETPAEIKKIRDEISEFNNEVVKNGNEVDSEYNVYERYAEQLKKCVDKNGKIKKGKEDQVKVIKGQLKDALGIEIDVVKGQIKQYDKLANKINKTIEAKRAESLLQKDEGKYQESLSTKDSQAVKVADWSSKLEKAQSTVNWYDEQIKKAEDGIKRAEKSHDSALKMEFINQKESLQSSRAIEKQRLNDIQKHLNAEKAKYNSSANFVKNYEKLQEAIASGHSEKIKNAYSMLRNNLKRAGSATKLELLEQYHSAEANLKKIQKAYDNGQVDKAALNAAKRMVNATKKELNKADYSGVGAKAVKQLKSGFLTTSWNGIGNKISTDIRKGFLNSFGANPLAVPVKLKRTGKGTLPGLNGPIKIGKNAVGGIYKQGTFLTTFAEESAEAAIPINNEPRSKQLWIQTGKMLGMVNENIGQRAVNVAIDSSETNSLLRALLKKDSNLYVDGNKLVGATVGHRDRYDGIGYELEERGISY